MMNRCFICRSKIRKNREENDPATKLGDQISVIFILRKIMEIPTSICENLLVTHQNPSSWVSYCPDCLVIVKNAHKIFQKLLLLQKKLNTVKMQINNYIKVANADVPKTAIWTVPESAPSISDFLLNEFYKKLPEHQNHDQIEAHFQGNEQQQNTVKLGIFQLNDKDFSLSEDSNGSFGDNLDEDVKINLLTSGETEEIKVEIHSDEEFEENITSKSDDAVENTVLSIVEKNDCEKEDDFEKLIKPDRLKCGTCEKTYTHQTRLSIHKRREHPEEMTESCELCDEKFLTRMSYLHHFRRIHPESKPTALTIICECCGKSWKSRCQYKMHMQRHKGQKNFLCEICSKSFISSALMKEHRQWMHHKQLGIEPIKCNLCHKIMSSALSLERHTKIKHTRQFDIFCEVCNAGFVSRGNLRLHMERWHCEKPLFKCSICEKEFFTSFRLKVHIVQHHTKNFKYTCSICSKGFPTTKCLKRHMNVHSSVGRHRKKYASLPKVDLLDS